ncbi:MAG: exodeoxyribonuclease III [Pseudomonadota bacterium]|nr:exodeoxyribonuclease III [Pseudomonadota bacterium]
MKLVSWNVNGVRSVTRYGFFDWLAKFSPDVLCLQETKAQKDQLSQEIISPLKYGSHWHSAVAKGYSGVSMYFKKEPLNIIEGIGNKEIDSEGRVLTLEYKDFFLVNAYFPNSGRDHARLPYKLKFCKEILIFLNKLKKKNKHVVICGDFNIAHKEMDLANPKSNMKNAGFLPQERAWMDEFIKKDYIDVYRHFSQDIGSYTWWSYRPGVRERNIGWRLDYFCSDIDFADRIESMLHLTQIKGSDHCPVVIKLK